MSAMSDAHLTIMEAWLANPYDHHSAEWHTYRVTLANRVTDILEGAADVDGLKCLVVDTTDDVTDGMMGVERLTNMVRDEWYAQDCPPVLDTERPAYRYIVTVRDVGNITNKADNIHTILTSPDNIQPRGRVTVQPYAEERS